MHVHVFTSGSPVTEHAFPHVLHLVDADTGATQICQSRPKYSEAKLMSLDDITRLARDATVAMATARGIDPYVIEMALETTAQWETATAARADKYVYDVFCCIEPDVMTELVTSEQDGARVFGRSAVTDGAHVMSIGDDDDQSDGQ